MKIKRKIMESLNRSSKYQICLDGKLDERWMRWFEDMEVHIDSDNRTIISGEFDQSALHGLFNRIRDLGITLISVQCDTQKYIASKNIE